MALKLKLHHSLNFRLTLLIIFMTLGAGIVLSLVGYTIYRRNMEEKYIDLGEDLTATAAELIEAERAEKYLETLMQDEEYGRILTVLRSIWRNNNIQALYVVRFMPDGSHFIFDAGDSAYSLGFVDPWNEGFDEPQRRPFLEGREILPEIYNSNLAGRVLTVHSPLRYRDGSVAPGYYAAADFSINVMLREQYNYFKLLTLVSMAAALVFAFIHWVFIHRFVVKPVNDMTAAVYDYLKGDIADGEIRPNKSGLSGLTALSVQTGDEMEVLAESLKNMEGKTWKFIQSLNEANRKASTDALTQLHNREAFYNNVSVFMLRNRVPGQVHAFMELDIDRFKLINDTYGHPVGDEVLKQCAAALSRVFRRSDEVARLGGDEFTIFCPNVGSRGLAEQKAVQILEAFIRIKPAEEAGGVTASIGIVILSDEPVTYEDLFSKADSTLYYVKTNGRNGYKIINL
jgi:diguanylate cyclase (GGDEF)-like protein